MVIRLIHRIILLLFRGWGGVVVIRALQVPRRLHASVLQHRQQGHRLAVAQGRRGGKRAGALHHHSREDDLPLPDARAAHELCQGVLFLPIYDTTFVKYWRALLHRSQSLVGRAFLPLRR